MRAVTAATRYRPLSEANLGFGLMTRNGPDGIPRGAAMESLDCDYNGRSIASRRGFVRVHENGPGAVQVGSFEATETWASLVPDTTNFVVDEVDVTGVRGASLSGGNTGTQRAFAPTVTFGTDPADWFHAWVRLGSVAADCTQYRVELRLKSAGGNFHGVLFAVGVQLDVNGNTLQPTQYPNIPEIGKGMYFRIRRDSFYKVSSPTWTGINEVEVRLIANGGGASITIDNIHYTPGRVQALFQFRREQGAYQGARNNYAVAGGTLYKSNGKRWVAVQSLFDAKADVHHIVAQDRCILTDGVTSPRLLMEDGSTIYRLGIVTPPKQMTAALIASTRTDGLSLTPGTYFAQMLWYSSKTGAFSAPDDRIPELPIITVPNDSNLYGIRFSNIPVSADPQVDWVVIGMRPETEPENFFRVSDGLHGDAANGTTTADFHPIDTELLARRATIIDPDLDYPTIIDSTTGLPVEAHPRYIEEIGGYIVAVMAERPTVVRISRFRRPTAWQIDDEIPVGENDSEPVTALRKVASMLAITKASAVYPGRAVGGETKIVIDPPMSTRGALDPKGIVAAGHQALYRGEDGAYIVGPQMQPALVTDEATPTWKETWDPEGFGSGAGVELRAPAQVLLFGRSLGSRDNDIGWAIHYHSVLTPDVSRAANKERPRWAATVWRMPGEQATEVREHDGWQAWTAGRGQVWHIDYGQQDDDRALRVSHTTGLWTPDPRYVHLWKYLDVDATCSGDFDLTVNVYVGMALQSDGSRMADLKGNAAVLPLVLGTSRLGAPPYVRQRLRLPRIPSHAIGFEFSFTGRGALEIRRLTLWYQTLGPRRATA